MASFSVYIVYYDHEILQKLRFREMQLYLHRMSAAIEPLHKQMKNFFFLFENFTSGTLYY